MVSDSIMDAVQLLTPYSKDTSMLTVKIGTNRSDRSDRAVRPVEALWPVRQGPTGLTGPGRVRVQLGFFIDLDL